MEYRDVYTREGAPKGAARPKHAHNQPGDYFLHAIDILRCDDGRYILQQRSLSARHYPGVWDVTGGGVLSGETPPQAGIREAMEELGVTVDPENMREIYRYHADWDDGTGLIIYVYGCLVHMPEGGLHFSRAEVNDVAIVPFQQFYDAVMFNKDAAFGQALVNYERSFENQ